MSILQRIYGLRIILGILAAVLSSGYLSVMGGITKESPPLATFTNSLSLAIIVYVLSYYLIKNRYGLKIEKTRKLLTTGIGIYFISWIVFWSLLYTLMVV
jgi:hypothetical protein